MPATNPPTDAHAATLVRVLLVDDQALLRESFKRLLELVDGGITVVGVAADGQDALAAMERLSAVGAAPHVVLMDVRMPRLNGVEATRQIAARWPETHVVILSTFDDEELIISGLRAGARGYLLKDTSSDALVRAIHAAARGETPIQPEVASKLVAHVARPSAEAPLPTDAAGGTGAPPASDLTEREREILRLVARGASNREVGETLFITEGTVKNHVSNILSKLGLRDRTQAAVYAHEHGLV
jgi:DNA-binding NarL/FixJ family response regulator